MCFLFCLTYRLYIIFIVLQAQFAQNIQNMKSVSTSEWFPHFPIVLCPAFALWYLKFPENAKKGRKPLDFKDCRSIVNLFQGTL